VKPYTYWMTVSTVLQLSHPALATVVPAFGTMAGILGVGIPFAVALIWARSDPMAARGGAGGRGFVLGWVPALIGLALAFSLGQVGPTIVIFGGFSSGVAGALAAVVGTRGRKA
jgi:hypothetical protein